MAHDLDAIFYVSKAPTVEFREGNFHVCYDIGKRAQFEVVMPPRAFLRARLLGADVIAQWRLSGAPDEGKVTRIRKR